MILVQFWMLILLYDNFNDWFWFNLVRRFFLQSLPCEMTLAFKVKACTLVSLWWTVWPVTMVKWMPHPLRDGSKNMSKNEQPWESLSTLKKLRQLSLWLSKQILNLFISMFGLHNWEACHLRGDWWIYAWGCDQGAHHQPVELWQQCFWNGFWQLGCWISNGFLRCSLLRPAIPEDGLPLLDDWATCWEGMLFGGLDLAREPLDVVVRSQDLLLY